MYSRTLMLPAIVLAGLFLGNPALHADERPVSDWVAALKSPDESARLKAVDQLGVRGPKAAEAVAPLCELLRDASPKVRAHAAWALGEIGVPAKPAVAALAESLKDPDATVRRQAVRAMLSIRPGPQVLVPLCIDLLEDPDPGVRIRVLHAIAEAGPKAVPGLIEALRNDRTAYWACVVLRDIGPGAKDAVPALADKLHDPRPEIRREAILALAAMDEAAAPAVPQIAAALPDEHVRAAATYALGRLGRIPADAEAPIRANAAGDDPMLSATSLWALARVYPEDKQLRREATERLIAGLMNSDPFVRVAAARALASLPPAPEITAPIWEKALDDADEKTVRHALDALAELGPAAAPALIDALEHEKLRVHIAYVLGRLGPAAAPAAPALAQLLADPNERIVREAALALAEIGPAAKDAVPALIQAVENNPGENAPALIYALGKIGPDAASAKPQLLGLLKSPDRKLALAAAWALVHIQPGSDEVAAQTIPVLTAGLAESAPLARRASAEGLATLGPLAAPAAAALEKAANDADEVVRKEAAKALAALRAAPN